MIRDALLRIDLPFSSLLPETQEPCGRLVSGLCVDHETASAVRNSVACPPRKHARTRMKAELSVQVLTASLQDVQGWSLD